MNLGRLQKVDLRKVWLSEPGDFTPWLAGEENLGLLSETLGMDLDLVAQEQGVGPFRADIVCTDGLTQSTVLIENQLERTDHTHLGQLLTYAAGLEAVSIVWIARRFADEHRAALDWLNDNTGEALRFFGLEVELWRIGDSHVAPKFNVVCEPNEWVKATNRPKARTTLGELYAEYWLAFRDVLEARSSAFVIRGAPDRAYVAFAIGRAGFGNNAVITREQLNIRVELYLSGKQASARFYALMQERPAIEAAFGDKLDWQELPDKIASRIAYFRPNSDVEDRASWPEQHRWLADHLQRIQDVFCKRVAALRDTDLS
ncbi:hypothetical protein Pla175_17810 [Pirellulimonas nuda]|uniref:DUF4268 domain-containing protein n=1 Tax=Pirellulimonas nuda TaxID=2528009 RepID=A0A518DA94_9BACT|nr:DUF4268 domain-containing protein [Pirellulimonas nuda]QDU88405.1 hypothetical protein Pla175_17810 [Pirellulimonas nuda]